MSSLPCCGSFCSLSFPCELYIALIKPSLTGRPVEWSYHYPLLPWKLEHSPEKDKQWFNFLLGEQP